MELKFEKDLMQILRRKGIYRDNLIFTIHQVDSGWQLFVTSEIGTFSLKLKTGDVKIYKTLNTVGRKLMTFGIEKFTVHLSN